MPGMPTSAWVIGLGALFGCASAYPTGSRYSCTDPRTIGISSSSEFMTQSQSVDTSMSLVIIGSVSGPIVSGTGSTSGTYAAGETLTVSTSGATGKYMFEADIDGFGACDITTNGFTRAYGSSSSSAADQTVTAPTDGSTIVIKSIRATAYSSGNFVNEATLSDLAATPVPTMRPSPLPMKAPYTVTSTVTEARMSGGAVAFTVVGAIAILGGPLLAFYMYKALPPASATASNNGSVSPTRAQTEMANQNKPKAGRSANA